jgi:hypothetical protein
VPGHEVNLRELRSLKRRLSDVVYRQLAADARKGEYAADAVLGVRCYR